MTATIEGLRSWGAGIYETVAAKVALAYRATGLAAAPRTEAKPSSDHGRAA